MSENEVLGPGDWRETDNAEEGTPAIIPDGPRAGTQITIQRPKNSENAEPKKVKTLTERKEAKTRQRKRKAIEMMIQAIKDGETATPDRHIIYLMAACKGTRAVCGDHFDYKTKQTFNSLELPDKIMSFASLQNKDVSESAKLDLFFWESVCENIFTELSTGQSGPDEPRWAEAGVVASWSTMIWKKLLPMRLPHFRITNPRKHLKRVKKLSRRPLDELSYHHSQQIINC